ncbi:MAG: hypothetical protein WBY93_17740 [Candidatus Binatus sp.]
MSKTVVLPGAASTVAQGPAIIARRIRFIADAAAGAKVRRVFHQPRPCFAVDEAIEPQKLLPGLPGQQPLPEPVDELVVVLLASAASAEARKFSANLLAAADRHETGSTISIAVRGNGIQWRPGFAMVQGPALDGLEGAVDALTNFSFYEGELRSLERVLDTMESDAHTDVARAYRIRFRDRLHWRRIRKTVENLAQMRLAYARLESEFAKAPRALGGDARQVMMRLIDEAEVDTRLEAASNRLEAFEDLYEGANDRIADYRWYLSSEWLEVGIIFLLLVEVAMLGFQIHRHLK